jgi:hypothetical protein
MCNLFFQLFVTHEYICISLEEDRQLCSFTVAKISQKSIH